MTEHADGGSNVPSRLEGTDTDTTSDDAEILDGDGLDDSVEPAVFAQAVQTPMGDLVLQDVETDAWIRSSATMEVVR